MGLKTLRPTSPGRRFRQTVDYSELTGGETPRNLLQPKKRSSGRNSSGRITMRRLGGGAKQQYRVIDFRRDKIGVPGRVTAVQYDPNRTAHLALITYADGEKRFILCPQGVTVGHAIMSGKGAEVKPGNALPLGEIPVGEMVHNVELQPGGGGKLARGAGVSAQLMAKTGKYALLRMPSGEQRQVLLTCAATVGTVGNQDHGNQSIGKAGANRWRGRRPKVRGVAMNPVDHPHGGGEGKTSGGRHPVSPWGTPTKGYKTRHNKRTDKFIARRRK